MIHNVLHNWTLHLMLHKTLQLNLLELHLCCREAWIFNSWKPPSLAWRELEFSGGLQGGKGGEGSISSAALVKKDWVDGGSNRNRWVMWRECVGLQTCEVCFFLFTNYLKLLHSYLPPPSSFGK